MYLIILIKLLSKVSLFKPLKNVNIINVLLQMLVILIHNSYLNFNLSINIKIYQK